MAWGKTIHLNLVKKTRIISEENKGLVKQVLNYSLMTTFFNNLLLGELSHFKTYFKRILSSWKIYSLFLK